MSLILSDRLFSLFLCCRQNFPRFTTKTTLRGVISRFKISKTVSFSKILIISLNVLKQRTSWCWYETNMRMKTYQYHRYWKNDDLFKSRLINQSPECSSHRDQESKNGGQILKGRNITGSVNNSAKLNALLLWMFSFSEATIQFSTHLNCWKWFVEEITK